MNNYNEVFKRIEGKQDAVEGNQTNGARFCSLPETASLIFRTFKARSGAQVPECSPVILGHVENPFCTDFQLIDDSPPERLRLSRLHPLSSVLALKCLVSGRPGWAQGVCRVVGWSLPLIRQSLNDGRPC